MIRRSLFLFVLILFVNIIYLHGQNILSVPRLADKLQNVKPDSNLVDYLVKIADDNKYKNTLKALKFLNWGLLLAEKINYQNGMAICYNSLAEIYLSRGEYSKAWDYYQNEKKIYERNNDSVRLADCYTSIGAFYCFQSNYPQAMDALQKSLKISEHTGNKYSLATCYNNIGSVHKNQKNYEKAIEYYKKALDLNIELDVKKGIYYAYNNIGTVFGLQGSQEQALSFFYKALNEAAENNDKYMMSYCYGNIGIIYKQEGELKKALGFINKSLEIKKELGEKDGISTAYSEMAHIYSLKGENLKAVEYARKAFVIADETGTLSSKSEALKRLSMAYENSGKYDEAIYYYKLYIGVKDSILNVETKNKIMKMELDYDIDKKEKEINLLNEKNRSQELLIGLEHEKKRNQLILLSGLIVLVVVSAVLIYNRYKYKQREILNNQKLISKKEQLKAVIDVQEKERTRFARDVHDGIGQYFTALKYKINTLEHDSSSSDISRFEEIDGLVDELYHEIRNISFNIMPQVIKLRGLIAAVEELAFKINLNRKITIDLNVFNLNERLPEHIEVSLYRVIQELLNNIIKYSKASVVSISFTKLENELNLMIEDNGSGFDTNVLISSEGHGWKNIKSRIEMINGSVDVDSHKGKTGTTVNINIPLT